MGYGARAKSSQIAKFKPHEKIILFIPQLYLAFYEKKNSEKFFIISKQ